MRRIVLAVALAFSVLLAPLAADAQPAGKVPRIGYLAWGSPASSQKDAFRQGLRDLGYVEGQSISIEYRYGKADQLPDLAAELVRLKVDVIVAVGTPSARAAKQATQTIPIVIVLAGDPVRSGLVTSLARPGGNVTGMSMLAPEVFAKALELLKEAVPKVSRVAILMDPTLQVALKNEVGAAAKVLGVKLQQIDVQLGADLDGTFVAALRQRAEAFFVFPLPMAIPEVQRIVEFSVKNRLPTMMTTRAHFEAGGLMSYGANFPDQLRRTSIYIDKILKGAKPSDLPIEQPTKYEFLINLKTAKALGLTIPQSVLIRADEVIQ